MKHFSFTVWSWIFPASKKWSSSPSRSPHEHQKKLTVFTFFLLLIVLNSEKLTSSEFSFQLDFASRYIWRGFDMNPDNHPVLKPSVTWQLGQSGFALNFWGSISLHDQRYTETDFTLMYTFKTPEYLTLSAGFTHYGWYFNEPFSFKNNTSQEFYLAAGLPTLLFKPALTVFYDVSTGSGLYMTLDLGHSVALRERLGLDFSARLAYNARQWIDESGFSDLTLGISLPYKTGKTTLAPFANVTFILLDAVNPGTSSELCFGFFIAF